EITLGQAANAFGGLSTRFSENMLSPVKVVDGPLSLSPDSLPSGASPNAWSQTISFNQPYTYLGGHLVVLITHTAADQEFPPIYLDAAPPTSEYTAIRNYLDYQAELATNTGDAVTVMQLHYAAVPEPAAC